MEFVLALLVLFRHSPILRTPVQVCACAHIRCPCLPNLCLFVHFLHFAACLNNCDVCSNQTACATCTFGWYLATNGVASSSCVLGSNCPAATFPSDEDSTCKG